MKIVRCMLLGMGLGDMFCVCGFPLFNHIINNLAILPPVYRIAMELYEAVSRRMGIPEVVIRVFMGFDLEAIFCTQNATLDLRDSYKPYYW